MNEHKVSLITVNYNQAAITLDLLRSIGEYDSTQLEVIVVDNGSKKNETEIIKRNYPDAIVIRSENNLGFAGGNNLGMQAANGDFLFLVNNDACVTQSTIIQLKKTLTSNPSAAIACPLIRYYDNPDFIQYAGSSRINALTGRNRALGYKTKLPTSMRIEKTAYAHGAAMMIKSEILENIGLMPEHYFLYYEELDWCHQIRNAGYDILVDHNCHVLHKESMTTGKSSPLKTYFQTRNRILFMRRNFNRIKQMTFFLFFTFLTVPKFIFQKLIAREFDHLRSFFEGVKWNLKNGIGSTVLGYKYDHLIKN